MSNTIPSGGYTELERRIAVSGGMNIDSAVRHLKMNAHIRSVRETLALCDGMASLDKAALKTILVSLLMRSNPGLNRNSVDKNVRNWLSDSTQGISKDYALQLAFAQGMSVENAEVWLTRLCGETFHRRDPRDIAWIFALGNGMDYIGACALMERLNEKNLLDIPKQESQEAMTSMIRREVSELRTEDELEEFLRDNRGRLGNMHNTAYKMFCEFLDILQNPGNHAPEVIPAGDNMSMRDVIATYMYNDYIPRACRRGKKQSEINDAVKSAIQRGIQKNWPDETTLSRMKNREIDVTRKVMILLFLATDGGESAYADMEDIDADEVFVSMEARLNLMLADCGFPQLDSRAPFDWMVLYCMYADESIFLEDYMRKFLEGIFADSTSEA